jgi:hypothetical protein
MSRILWAFSIELALGKADPAGPGPSDSGFVCMPEEFPSKITPRSKERADMMINEWRDAEKKCLDRETKQWLQSPVESDKALEGRS